MGLAWTSFMEEQWEALPQLRVMADNIKDPNLKIPDYYYAPIHAYKDGMLCVRCIYHSCKLLSYSNRNCLTC